MTLILASNNAHKLVEIAAILQGSGIVVQKLGDWPGVPEPPEDHDTFAGNALQKARWVFQRTGLPAVADDSGLEVAALAWGPGVHSKRYTPEATAQSNNRRLLAELADAVDRRARFRCVVAVVGPAGEATAEGVCDGTIVGQPRGEDGFGYDPLFEPSEVPGRTMAELTLTEKNRISHRGRAFRQLPELLARLGLA